jgi:hypothetical protein
MIGFTDPLCTPLGTTGIYSAISVLHTLQFTIPHEVGFSVFTSRIRATDFSDSHCHFNSHMKSSLHRLIPFLPLFCKCQFRGLDSALSTAVLYSVASNSKSHCDWRSVSQTVLVSSSHLGLMTRYLLLFDSYSLVIVGRPLWREDGCSVASQVKVTLRLTVSQSVTLGVEPHLGLMTRYLLLFDSYGLVFFCGAPPLTKGRVCLLSESLPALVRSRLVTVPFYKP